MKILVTGGLGFIGSNFIRLLLEETDYEVVNIDKITYAGNPENLADFEGHARYAFYKADICDFDALSEIFAKETPDYVVNFAAESHVDRSIENPRLFLETNILGVQAMLDCARKYGVARFLQVSTDEVYGSLGFDDPAFSESNPLQPNSPYSASKTSADLLVRAYHETFGLFTIITRCSNNYGPYQFPEKLIPLMINNALQDKPLPVYGDGSNVRDWIYVEDHCRGILAALERGQSGEIYNFGGAAEESNLNLVKKLLATLDKPESLITFVKDRPGHDLRYAMDFSKASAEIGWTPQVDFETGMARTVQWYLDHQDWLQNVISGDYQTYYDRMYGNR
ncbi:MAG TPA: dTDP-glucose 4,6-dehydratase [Candidatus Lokiarchaeia archaeon]|nr:dTDP-glucose 4,6-dehydratase [Candidatus Lokiarchaeia archaeon]